MSQTNPEFRDLYQILSQRPDWEALSGELRVIKDNIPSPHQFVIGEEELRSILELIPGTFSFRAGMNYYPIAFGEYDRADPQRHALARLRTTSTGIELKDYDIAFVLTRACHMIQPDELTA